VTLHDVQIPMRPQPAFPPVLRHRGSLIVYDGLYNYLLRGLRSPPIPGHRLLDALPLASIVLWPARLRTSHLEELMVVRGGTAPQKKIPPVSSTDDALDLFELAAYGDPAVVSVRTYRDGSSRHRDLEVDTLGPTLDADGNMVFDPSSGEQYLLRADAIALPTDPELTVVFDGRVAGNPAVDLPTLVSLGTLGGAELSVRFSGDATNDFVEALNFDGSSLVRWRLPLGSVLQRHVYEVLKVGAGYSSSWKLYVDGRSAGSPVDVLPGAMALGSTLFRLGGFDGGGFPFRGLLRGLMIWPQVLDADRRFAVEHYLELR
jgi:hypothetical protein